MKLTADLQELVAVSQTLGAPVAYVQGGGGNTSLKMAGNAMWIKASGTFLSGIDRDGFVSIDWQRFQDGFGSCNTEQDYIDLMATCALDASTALRPSIETGFHAILSACVLHSHSVWVNLLTCSVEGRDIAHELFPDTQWIGYATPGLPLTLELARGLNGRNNGVFFLENHGVVVSADTCESALEMHDAVNAKLRAHFATLAPFTQNMDEYEIKEAGGLLFPDQAIYLSKAHLAASRAGRETLMACLFLENRMRRAELTPHYLPSREWDVLVNMNSEQYRQQLVSR